MQKFTVENRKTYIYAKFTKHLAHGEIGAAAHQAKEMLKDNPTLNLLIDDSELRYKDLSANNKMESLEALALMRQCPKTAVVIAAKDEKLLHYANFALSYARLKNIKIGTDINEATTWVDVESKPANN